MGDRKGKKGIPSFTTILRAWAREGRASMSFFCPGPYARARPYTPRRGDRTTWDPREVPIEKGQSSGTPLAPENLPSQGVINVITRGPIDGDSNRARKSYARLMESLVIEEELVA